MKTVNCFDDHAPKNEWLQEFFSKLDEFIESNTLGPNMFTHFKRFLRDANLLVGNKTTEFAKLLVDLGWETETSLGLILTELAFNNAQFEWYIANMDIGAGYESTMLKNILVEHDMKDKAASSIVKSFKRITNTVFGTNLEFGYVVDDVFYRQKCRISDSRVLLYALYKFNQKCNLNGEFSVYSLYDEEVERDGLSPIRIFGLYDEDELRAMLKGLSAKYPEFINATFTNDLQSIILRDKTPEDVLKLFVED